MKMLLLLVALLGHWPPWAMRWTQTAAQLRKEDGLDWQQLGRVRREAAFVRSMYDMLQPKPSDCSQSSELNSMDFGSSSFDDEDFKRIDYELRRNYEIPQSGDSGCESEEHNVDSVNPNRDDGNAVHSRAPKGFFIVNHKNPQTVKSEGPLPFPQAQHGVHIQPQSNRKAATSLNQQTGEQLKYLKPGMRHFKGANRISPATPSIYKRPPENGGLKLHPQTKSKLAARTFFNRSKLLDQDDSAGGKALDLRIPEFKVPDSPVIIGSIVALNESAITTVDTDETLSTTTEITTTGGEETTNLSASSTISQNIDGGKTNTTQRSPPTTKSSIKPTKKGRNFKANAEPTTSIPTVSSKVNTTAINKKSKNPINIGDQLRNKNNVKSKIKTSVATSTSPTNITSRKPLQNNDGNRRTNRTQQNPKNAIKGDQADDNGPAEKSKDKTCAQRKKDTDYATRVEIPRNRYSGKDKRPIGRAQPTSSLKDICADETDTKAAEDDLSGTGSNCHEFFAKPRYRSKSPKQKRPVFSEPMAFETSLHNPLPKPREKRPRNDYDFSAPDESISKSANQFDIPEYSAPYDSYGKRDYYGSKQNSYRDDNRARNKPKHRRPPTVKLNKIIPRRPPPQQTLRLDSFGKRFREFKLVEQHPQICEDELDSNDSNEEDYASWDYGNRQRIGGNGDGDGSSDYRESKDYPNADFGQRQQYQKGGDRSSDYRESQEPFGQNELVRPACAEDYGYPRHLI